MSLSNKLFSLLGFPEPLPLKRSNDTNALPNKVLLVSARGQNSGGEYKGGECTGKQINADIHQSLSQLKIHVIAPHDDLSAKSIETLVVDTTDFIDESSYQNLFETLQSRLHYLADNARVLFITNSSSYQSPPAAHIDQINQDKDAKEKNIEICTFNQALIGFTKSLAKEIGRKGSTANIICLDNRLESHNSDDISNALMNPIAFLLSAKSAFVSGQKITLNLKNTFLQQLSSNTNKQKIALVTGAAQGIGAAIANKLAFEGYLVIGVDIEPMSTQLTETMKAIKGESFILDVSSQKAGEQLATLAKKHSGFDLIVHNAGITRDKTLAKMPEHFWKQTLNINLFSVMRINKTLINNKCINTGGSIVCLSSMNGIAGQGGQTNYACSKAGIIGYVASISDSLLKDNITINAVAPGFIETQMTQTMPFFTREMGRRMNALGQGGQPIDVAETVAFLGKGANLAISGQTIRVCGLNIIGA